MTNHRVVTHIITDGCLGCIHYDSDGDTICGVGVNVCAGTDKIAIGQTKKDYEAYLTLRAQYRLGVISDGLE